MATQFHSTPDIDVQLNTYTEDKYREPGWLGSLRKRLHTLMQQRC
jgi:hypothetical protein